MAFSRRRFLSLLGLLPAAAVRFRYGGVTAKAAPADDLVVYRGWVLRRDDLAKLPHK